MTDARETKPESERLAPLSSEEKRNLVGLGVLAGAWAFVPAGLGFLLLARLGDLSDFYGSVTGTQGIAASKTTHRARGMAREAPLKRAAAE